MNRTVQDLIGVEFQFKDDFNNMNLESPRFVRMNSPFYKGEKWAVRIFKQCLNKESEWEWEPPPSFRDADFYTRCRFDSLEQALDAYNKSIDVDYE